MDDTEKATTSHRHTEKTKRVQLVYLKRITFLIFFLTVMQAAQCQLYKNCNSNGEFQACFPSAERILQSNPTQLQVDPPDVTCGLQVQESYLRLGDTTFRQYFCNPGQHVKEKMIDEDPLNTWWQSKTWTVEQYDTTLPNPQYAINVTLSIKKKYRMSQNITITFNSGRPQEMVIEKSADQGQTWQTLQYYARDCSVDYPEAPSSYLSNLTAVICTEVYSKDTSNPQSGLKVYFPGSSERMKTYTTMQYYTEMENKDMQNFLIFTDIRLRLLFPATDSRERSRRPEDFLKYYYAISDIDITGSCFCNLHSGGCITDPATNDTMCDCSHNTEGVDCERCKPLYNNRPWREGSFLPARVGEANACEKCECYDHATSCTYNATYGEGVCDDCTHNTTGRHCDRCLDGFFPDISLPLNHSAVCSPCDCEVMGLLSPTDASCLNDRTAPDVGHCTCKNLVTGRRCDQCVDGYFGLLDPATPGTCKLCGCQVFGTEANSGACDQTSGQCQCKSSIQGRICDSCKDGYYSFPTLSSEECDPCGCDSGGSASHTCDEFGICTCIPHVIGDKCNQVEPNFYIPSLDEFIKQPTGGTCTVAGDLWTTSNPFDGDVFATCPPGVSSEVEFEDLNGNDQQLELRWPYFVGIRYTLLGTEGRYGGNLDIEVTRNSDIDVNQFAVDGNIPESACPTTFGTTYSTQLNFSVGVSTSVLGETSFMFDRRCIYTIKLTLPSQINSTDILVDSAIFMPDLSNTENGAAFITLSNSTDPNTVITTYNSCKAQLSSLISRQTAMSSTQCRELLWSISSEIHKEGKPCNCDQMGSTLTTCQHFGGKCTCKFGVGGRSCNKCLPGYFNMTDSGCTQCNCAGDGSLNGACDPDSGQCACRPNVAKLGEPDTEGNSNSRQCSACVAGFYGYGSVGGCTNCECNSLGANSTQCSPDGQCPCKDTIGGERCDRCADSYFQFSESGCQPCNCDPSGRISDVCDHNNGICSCKPNAEGDKCNVCKTGFFNLAVYNPRGCQPCFCFGHSSICSSADNFQKSTVTAESTAAWTLVDGLKLAPEEFLGDKHSSYGQLLKWNYFFTGGEGNFTQLDLVIISGDGSNVTYRHPSETIVGDNRFMVRLFPENWILDGGASPDPQKLYRILASMTQLSFATQINGIDVQLSDVAMETSETAEGVTAADGAAFVEQCTCGGDVVGGFSCERCESGYQRVDPAAADTRYGACKSCDCNLRTEGAAECDEITGRCLNCRNGTAGDDCSICAPNVVEPSCDVCFDGFWGLGADGCRECNCSETGTIQGTQCDKTSGQCVCASHVTGRQCDTCEENYQLLTTSGCSECDGCYKLVMEEADKLRSLLANTSDVIATLKTNDQNADLGPFYYRVTNATANLNKLLEFLKTANNEEADVRSRINQYNSTIVSLTTQLEGLNDTDIPDIQRHLQETDQNLRDSTDTRTQTINNIKAAYAIQDPLTQISSTMAAFVTSLKQVEDYLTSSTANSTSQVTNIITTVQTIESFARLAVARADSDQRESKELFDLHRNTSEDIAKLEIIELTLDALSSTALTEGQRLNVKSNDTYYTAMSLQTESDEIGSPTTSFEYMNNTLDMHRRQLATTKQDALNGKIDVKNKTETVNQAIIDSEQQRMETNNIIKQCDELNARLVAAKRKTEDAKLLEEKTFFDAQNMLDTMRNFESKALEVEQHANTSLAYVTAVNADSEKVISDAAALMASLTVAQQSASSSQETARQAQTTAQSQNSDLTPVFNRASGLQQNLTFNHSDLSQKSDQPRQINESDVIPAQARCDQKGSDITTATLLVDGANILAEDTKNSVEFTIDDARRVLSDLNNLPNIDHTRIAQLAEDVVHLPGMFNEQELISTINALKTNLEEQTTWLNTLKAKKAKLEREIAMIKASQAIIST